MTKIIKNFVTQIIIISQLSSCAKEEFFYSSFKDHPSNSAKAIFRVKSDRLVYKDKGPEASSVMLKWCKTGSNCQEYFHSFHCERSLFFTTCDEMEKNFTKEQQAALPSEFFPESYSLYSVSPGSYYMEKIIEVSNGYKITNPLVETQDPLLGKRTNEMKPMAKDSVFSKVLVYPGAVIIVGSGQGGLLPVVAVGLGMVMIGMSINGIFTGDPVYVGNFNSIDGWNKTTNQPNFISFEVKPNETAYIGDINLHLRARGGFWTSRRNGLIDLEVRDNLQSFLRSFPNYQKVGVVKRLAKEGGLVGQYGAGRF